MNNIQSCAASYMYNVNYDVNMKVKKDVRA